MNVSKILSTHLSEIPLNSSTSSKLYEAPNIPDKKLDNAIKAMSITEMPEDVRAIIDTSLFQNAKTGILFTNKHLYIHESLMSPSVFEYQNIAGATYDEEIKITKGKEKIIPHVTIEFADDTPQYAFPDDILSWVNSKPLAQLLENFANEHTNQSHDSEEDAENDDSTTTIYSLEDLPSKVKLAYTQLLCNFAMYDDHQIDPDEYRSIISFAVRISLPHDEQIQLNNYLIGDALVESSTLFSQLHSEISEATEEILNESLMKDLLSIINQKNDQSISDWQSNQYLCELAENLDLSADQVNVLVAGIQHDQLILDQRLNDTQIKKRTKDLAAKAAAVGVPLTALYFSGAVGVSAAGITSGLAAFGFGGILGLSSMVSGIGVLILAGTATYKGVEHLTGRKDVENNKQREALLQQIVKNTQKTLNYW